MKTKKFVRNPVYVDAVRVTGKNMTEVAEWCGGEIATVGEKVTAKFIRLQVKRPLSERQTKAFVGDWVLHTDTGFKIYTPKAFEKSFSEVIVYTEADARAQLQVIDYTEADARAQLDDTEAWRKANPVMTADCESVLESGDSPGEVNGVAVGFCDGCGKTDVPVQATDDSAALVCGECAALIEELAEVND